MKSIALTYVELLLYISFVGMLIYGAIHWEDEIARYNIMLICAILGVMKEEVEALTNRLAETDKSKEELERLLEEQKAKLDLAIENNKKTTLREDTQRRDLLHSNAYAVAKNRLEEGKPISNKDWEQMEKELNNISCNFKSVLYEAYELTEQEYRICRLVKMGFKNNEVSILISRAPNAVSLARKRLFSKITGKEGTAYDFDLIIKSL